MKTEGIVYESSKGHATIEWHNKNGDIMYLIHFNDGRKLYTNSMNIIKDELKDNKQLQLF